MAIGLAFIGLGRFPVGSVHTVAPQLWSVFMGCWLFHNLVRFSVGVSVPTCPFTVESLVDP